MQQTATNVVEVKVATQQTAVDMDQVKVATQQTAVDVDEMKIATQQTAVDVDQVKVATQQAAVEIDHVKRLLFNLISAVTMPYASLQGSNCEKAFTNGSPHRIPQQIITSHVIPITRKPRLGFSRAASFRSGSQQDHFFGSMENVCPVLFPTWFALIPSCIPAGSGKSILWFVVS